jgi:predicted CXXCH cytochrome family protein
MKKTIIALAIAAFASTASALVGGSSHDMRTFNASATKGACQYCHAPHFWGGTSSTFAGAPLWNRTAPDAADITNYTGDAGDDTTVSPVTRACLSCHDGATDIGTGMINNPDIALGAITADEGTVGLNLADDHPVGVAFPTTGGEYVAPGAEFQPDMIGATQTVGCSTCHDVHGGGASNFPAFLVADPDDDFCANCHNK